MAYSICKTRVDGDDDLRASKRSLVLLNSSSLAGILDLEADVILVDDTALPDKLRLETTLADSESPAELGGRELEYGVYLANTLRPARTGAFPFELGVIEWIGVHC